MNLINNGIQASGVKPKLCVELKCEKQKKNELVKIIVRDEGQGISQENLQRAQDIFVTTKSQGTGLGLSVVQSVARAHGGSFSLSSELGKGTQAIFELPTLAVHEQSER